MKKLLFIIIPALALAGCKKKDSPAPCTTDQASLAGSYRTTAVKYKASAASPEQDYYNFVFPDPCDRDDIVTLNANGNYTLTDAGVQCSPSNNDTGTWSLVGTTVTIDGQASSLQSWDCSTLIIYENNVITAGDKLTITMVRQ